jgi:hypothetical protein
VLACHTQDALKVLPGLSSITIALTLADMPCSGHTNSRAVIALTVRTTAASAMRATRQRLCGGDGGQPVRSLVPLCRANRGRLMVRAPASRQCGDSDSGSHGGGRRAPTRAFRPSFLLDAW